MLKLKNLLNEIIINEFNKSQANFIANELNIPNDDSFKSLLNGLNSQGIKYFEIKSKMLNGDIKNLKDLEKLKGVSKKDELRRIKNDGAEKVFENKDISIYIPYTWEASCIYGRGTHWCTAAKDDEGSFETQVIYDKDTLYYIIDRSRKDEFKKVAIVVNKKGNITEMFDDEDTFDYYSTTFGKDTTTIEQAYQNYLKYLKLKGIDISIFKSKASEIGKMYKDY